MKPVDHFYLNLLEPDRSFWVSTRDFILSYHPDFTLEWKYKLPFFYFKGKPFCYMWRDAKSMQPYVGFARSNRVEHPLLIQGNRKKMKVLYLDINKDLPIVTLKEIMDKLLKLY
jgi:hypothetical protein